MVYHRLAQQKSPEAHQIVLCDPQAFKKKKNLSKSTDTKSTTPRKHAAGHLQNLHRTTDQHTRYFCDPQLSFI